jgi:hypothetical protein
MINDKDYAYSKISSSAMLVDVSISVWTGRKLDKSVSAEIDSAKQTKTKAGNYHKNLLAGSEKLAEIGKIASAVRNWHYTQTSPWNDAGSRLLPSSLFMDYKLRLTEYEKMFTQAVTSFLAEYDTLITKSAFQLGDLFNREDYPDVSKIAHKFGFLYSFSPVPESGDFRVDIGEAGMAELRANYENAYKSKVEVAMQDAKTRLHEQLTHMSERLSSADGDTKKIFRDSLIDNAVELCQVLKHLNITKDPQLEQMRYDLEQSIKHIDAQSLRESDELRRATKNKVDSLLNKFAF